MKRFFLTIFVTLALWAVPNDGWCQSQTKQVIEAALVSGRHYLHHSDEVWIKVDDCKIDIDDFNEYFKQNTQFKPEFVRTSREVKYRREYIYVTYFEFHNNPQQLGRLEYYVRLENKNQSLKLPSFKDIIAANTFYQKYVKSKASSLVNMYKREFATEFTNYLRSDPQVLKRFCDSSPYLNNDLVNEIDVLGLIKDFTGKYDYVYLKTATSGYYFDKAKRFRYIGEIRNGLPNGKGHTQGATARWEGTYKDGVKNGQFTYTYTNKYYRGIEPLLVIDGYDGYNDIITYKMTGNCVNDQWSGEVRTEITCTTSRYSDVITEYYSNGKASQRRVVSNRMTQDIQEMRVMQKVSDVYLVREDDAPPSSMYKVIFKDGYMGIIQHLKYDNVNQWVTQAYCPPNVDISDADNYVIIRKIATTKNGAIVELYKIIHK